MRKQQGESETQDAFNKGQTHSEETRPIAIKAMIGNVGQRYRQGKCSQSSGHQRTSELLAADPESDQRFVEKQNACRKRENEDACVAIDALKGRRKQV